MRAYDGALARGAAGGVRPLLGDPAGGVRAPGGIWQLRAGPAQEAAQPAPAQAAAPCAHARAASDAGRQVASRAPCSPKTWRV